MLVINVFGLGVIYRVLELPNTMVSKFETVAKAANVSFSNVFFDFDLIEKCGIESFKDLPIQQKGIGSLIHTDTILEIRQQRRKINQFQLSDLKSQEYLFQLYNTNNKHFEVSKKEGFQYFFLYQVIKGRIVKYLMHNFEGIDYLEFENTRFNFENQEFDMLTSLKYKGDLLTAESDDSVVIEQHVIQI